jgi:hypothetical protein
LRANQKNSHQSGIGASATRGISGWGFFNSQKSCGARDMMISKRYESKCFENKKPSRIDTLEGKLLGVPAAKQLVTHLAKKSGRLKNSAGMAS